LQTELCPEHETIVGATIAGIRFGDRITPVWK